MPKIAYVSHRFNAGSTQMIAKANAIIEEYSQQGLSLTLRQLYYQFVARGFLPNKQNEYKRLGNVINDARLAGLIDWNAIEDRTRSLRGVSHWDRPNDILHSAAQSYRIDKWQGQEIRPEVWIEKEALSGVVAGICRELDVDYFACRGYNSQSEQWAAGQRMLYRYQEHGQRTLVLHFGDHDPSGLDMTNDNTSRLDLFTHNGCVELRRLALNMDQVLKYNPPPNPAKMQDSRFDKYQEEYGDESWELDALEPNVIINLIRQEVLGVRDDDKWNALVAREERERAKLAKLAKEYK
jgi:hypothetical protein